MIKEIENKDFCEYVKVYSGIKDCFGRKCLILINEITDEMRIVYANTKEYDRRRKWLDSHGYSYIGIMPKYGKAIDFTEQTAKEIKEYFSGHHCPELQIWK